MKKMFGALVAACLLASPVHAEQRVHFEAPTQPGLNVRYSQGVATYDLRRERGAVQITPLGLDHGRLTFGVVALNLGTASGNFGVENIRASIGGEAVPVLTRERLDQMATNRARWTQIAIAVVAGVAAASAASSRDTYRATTFTPRGTYRTIVRTRSAGGQVAAAGLVAGGAYTISSIQDQLDATRAALAEEIVQTTTIDPEDSYGGRFVVEKPGSRNRRWPQDVAIVISFNGEDYPFNFRVTRAR